MTIPDPYTEVATFGAGCFWGIEHSFKTEFKDAVKTEVGYTGGTTDGPTYRDVCNKGTGHAEVMFIILFMDRIVMTRSAGREFKSSSILQK